MKRTTIISTAVILVASLMGCNNQKKSPPEEQIVDSDEKKITNEMKSFISLFEIPALDASRAINFYQAILDISIDKMEMSGMEMGIFPYEEQMITGIIVKGEGYNPSADGVTIYLNGGDNLQTVLDKVVINGGKIIAPKTPLADESGFFALFLDTEGNRIGLNSPN